MDITIKNYITEERGKKIANADVVHVAINNHGNWLVTFEADYPDVEISCDYFLKFWFFNEEHQKLVNIESC